MAIAAGLYPLWGALWGGLGATWFLRQPHSTALWLPFLWWRSRASKNNSFPDLAGGTFSAQPRSGRFGSISSIGQTLRAWSLAALAAHTISRALVIVMAWISRPTAAGFALSKKMNSFAAGFAIACGAVTAFLFGFRPGVIIMLVGFLILRLVRQHFYNRHGGINTRALSLAQHATELSTLLVALYLPQLF